MKNKIMSTCLNMNFIAVIGHDDAGIGCMGFFPQVEQFLSRTIGGAIVI